MFSILDKTTFQRADFSEVKFALTLFTHQYSFFENASTIHKIVSEKPLNYSVCDNAIPESVSNRNKTKFTIKNNYFCLNNSDYEKLKFVSDSNDSSIYYYSEINLDVICSSNNCDKLLNSFILSFAIVENFIDLSNTYNPNNTVLKLKNFPLTSMMSLNLNIELRRDDAVKYLEVIFEISTTFSNLLTSLLTMLFLMATISTATRTALTTTRTTRTTATPTTRTTPMTTRTTRTTQTTRTI